MFFLLPPPPAALLVPAFPLAFPLIAAPFGLLAGGLAPIPGQSSGDGDREGCTATPPGAEASLTTVALVGVRSGVTDLLGVSPEAEEGGGVLPFLFAVFFLVAAACCFA